VVVYLQPLNGVTICLEVELRSSSRYIDFLGSDFFLKLFSKSICELKKGCIFAPAKRMSEYRNTSFGVAKD